MSSHIIESLVEVANSSIKRLNELTAQLEVAPREHRARLLKQTAVEADTCSRILNKLSAFQIPEPDAPETKPEQTPLAVIVMVSDLLERLKHSSICPNCGKVKPARMAVDKSWRQDARDEARIKSLIVQAVARQMGDQPDMTEGTARALRNVAADD